MVFYLNARILHFHFHISKPYIIIPEKRAFFLCFSVCSIMNHVYVCRPGYDASVEASHDAETTGNSGEVEPAETGGTLRASDNTYSELFIVL